MAFEERFALLCERAQRDFDNYLRGVAHMDAPGVFSEAKKIVVMEEMLSQIKSGQLEHPFDVELLLYHDHPLLAAYEQWERDGTGIAAAVNESVNGFLAKMRNRLAEMQGQYDTLTPDEQARIMEYHNREMAVFDYLQDREIRGENLSMLMESVRRDYAACQMYIKNRANLDGEYPADFAKMIEALYRRMKAFPYTDEQLDALNRLPAPLSSVYCAYMEIRPHGSLDDKTMDRAIVTAAGIRERGEGETRVQDDELDRE